MVMMPENPPVTGTPPGLDDAAQRPPVSTQPRSYTQHPIAAAFPPMPDVEFTALVEDIKAHGQRVPITLYEGQVLDGWHRYRACCALGIEPATIEFTGTIEEAAAFVVSLNARRRHLDTGQLALWTVESLLPQFEAEAQARQRTGKKTVPTDLCVPGRTGQGSPHRASTDAAKAVGVSPSSVERAKYVVTHGTAEDVAAVRSGTRKLKAVAKTVQKRGKATKTAATKPTRTKVTRTKPTRTKVTTTTAALALIPEPAALMLPDATMIAALKALNEDLHKHVTSWPGDPEYFIGSLRTWELMTRGHFDPRGPLEWRYMPSYDLETLTVRLPSEPLG
jgi:hypothetical protein